MSKNIQTRRTRSSSHGAVKRKEVLYPDTTTMIPMGMGTLKQVDQGGRWSTSMTMRVD